MYDRQRWFESTNNTTVRGGRLYRGYGGRVGRLFGTVGYGKKEGLWENVSPEGQEQLNVNDATP